MASKKLAYGGVGLAELIVIGIAGYLIYKVTRKPETTTATTTKLKSAPTFLPITTTTPTVKASGYQMVIPSGLTSEQKTVYQKALDDYVVLYEADPTGLWSPATAEGQRQAMVNYQTPRDLAQNIAAFPYDPTVDYMGWFGMTYPATAAQIALAAELNLDVAQVEQAEYYGITPEQLRQSAT